MKRYPLTLCVVYSAAVIASGQAPVRNALPGAVSGHVFCADTNLPCRYAGVLLQPMGAFAGNQAKPSSEEAGKGISGSTGLDGSFLIENIAPGNYLVMGELPGYLSPISTFPPDELKTDSEEVRKKLASILPSVSVVSGQVASVEVRLERGAVIGGEVRYDDGSPGINLGIRLFRKDKKGSWKPAVAESTGPLHFLGLFRFTDDRGRYRLMGLPTGEYAVEASLPEFTITPGSVFGATANVNPHEEGALKVYTPGVTRLHEAKGVTVAEGEERSDADIIIPLTGLHSLRGVVSSKADGHALSGGKVDLLDPDDRSVLRSVRVHADGTFGFDNVSEGSYLSRVYEGADKEGDKTIRAYEESEMKLTVVADSSNVNFSLSPKKAK